MTIGQRLRDLRTKKGLTQEEMASVLQVARTTYVKWESDISKPIRYVNELAAFHNVSIDYILSGTTINTEEPPSTDLLDFIKYGRYTIGDKPVRAEDRKKLLMAIIGILAALPLGGNDGE